MKTILFLFFACFLALGVLLALPTQFEYKQNYSSPPKDIPQETVNLRVAKEEADRMTYELWYINTQRQKIRVVYYPQKECLKRTLYAPIFHTIVCMRDSCLFLRDVESLTN